MQQSTFASVDIVMFIGRVVLVACISKQVLLPAISLEPSLSLSRTCHISSPGARQYTPSHAHTPLAPRASLQTFKRTYNPGTVHFFSHYLPGTTNPYKPTQPWDSARHSRHYRASHAHPTLAPRTSLLITTGHHTFPRPPNLGTVCVTFNYDEEEY